MRIRGERGSARRSARARGTAVLALICALLAARPLASSAAEPADPPAARPVAQGNHVYLESDTLTYDSDQRVVTATGHVAVTYGERTSVADTLIYNRDTGKVTAIGNVAITDPSGVVMFAERAELTDDLREGTIRSLEAVLTDSSHLSAAEAVRTGGNRTEFVSAAYTPCGLCPGRPPLWQIKAKSIVHDQTNKTITYHHATLDFWNVPVLYVPWFQHPDPTVKRKTGFLAPIFGHSGELGTSVETPWYWAPTPYRDVTISPVFSIREGLLLKGQYRERTQTGQFRFDGSIVRETQNFANSGVNEGDIRGHIFGHGQFNLSPDWRWGFDVQRTTDDTYLRRYDFSDADYLTSRLFLEGFRGRNYTVVNTYAFQGLRPTDRSGTTPLVLPYARYSFMSEPGRAGGYWTGDANMLVLQRSDGRDTRRLSTTVGYQIPYTSPFGEVYRGFVQVRGDVYDVQDAQLGGNGDITAGGRRDNGVTGRIRPVVGVDWRLPFIRPNPVLVQRFQPVVQLIYSPPGGNNRHIPNEDSQAFEFSDANLFDVNRFPGVDRWEGGARANTGIEWSGFIPNGASADALFGEVFRLRKSNVFSGTGLENKRSDYVGRITILPNAWLDVTHRFQLDKSDFSFRRNEIWLGLGPQYAHLNLAYIRLARSLVESVDTEDALADPALLGRKQLNLDGRLQVFHNWILTAGTRRDLTRGGSSLENMFGLLFHNDCIEVGLLFHRDNTRDRDVKPNTSVRVRFRLLNLG